MFFRYFFWYFTSSLIIYTIEKSLLIGKLINFIQVKNAANTVHAKWDKLMQRVNRRNAQLDENRRKSMIYSEKLSNYLDFVVDMLELLEEKRNTIDPRFELW